MRGMPFIIAASVLGLASAAQAVTPVYIEYEGVKGETAMARPAPEAGAHPADVTSKPAAPRGGVNVATKDIDGDSKGQALLLPAVQRVAPPVTAGQSPNATSTQGPYQVKNQTQAKSRPSESISLNYPKPKF